MDVNDVLENPEFISKDQFLQAYASHHSNRSTEWLGDSFSRAVYELHEGLNNVNYWRGFVKDVSGYLLLPHHRYNGKHFVSPGGEPFDNVVQAYSRHATGESCCNDKVFKMKQRHGQTWIESGNVDFVFLSDDSFLAHIGTHSQHYKETDQYERPCIFMGAGIHRLIAYGLLCEQQGKHIPIRVYYCQYAN